MNSHVPFHWFRHLSDAERVQSRLKALGILSVITETDDSSPGWAPDSSEGGATLWVDGENVERAKEVLGQMHASPVDALCEPCRRERATVHLTEYSNDVPSTRNLCQRCHQAEE